MNVGEFWNQAFLAALHRLPVKEARALANEALEEVIEHWQQFKDPPIHTETHYSEMDIVQYKRLLPWGPKSTWPHGDVDPVSFVASKANGPR